MCASGQDIQKIRNEVEVLRGCTIPFPQALDKRFCRTDLRTNGADYSRKLKRDTALETSLSPPLLLNGGEWSEVYNLIEPRARYYMKW